VKDKVEEFVDAIEKLREKKDNYIEELNF